MNATLQISVPKDSLIEAAKGLDSAELDDFLDELLRLRANRIAASIKSSEMSLVNRIRAATLSASQLKRLAELSERSEDETLSEAEHAELLALAGELETLNYRRVEAASELAAKRGESLDSVLASLGLLYGGK